MRCTVPVPIPSDLATFKIPTPFASCFRTFRSVALSIFGRPSFTPWATARLSPALIRWRINRPLEFSKGQLPGQRACPSGSSCRWPAGLGTSPHRTLRGVGSCRVSRSASSPGGQSPTPGVAYSVPAVTPPSPASDTSALERAVAFH
jgi:hypothetical protein